MTNFDEVDGGPEGPIRSQGGGVRVIELRDAPGERASWGKPAAVVYLWSLIELLIVTNPIQISSGLRVWVLKRFGAHIGPNVIFRPRTKVKFPWKLHVGAGSWIGEGVWFHNQDQVFIGENVVVSQEAFLTTGSHAIRKDMGLITAPIKICDGAWVTSRCVILGGTHIGRSSIVTPGTVVGAHTVIPDGAIFGAPTGTVIGQRFNDHAN